MEEITYEEATPGLRSTGIGKIWMKGSVSTVRATKGSLKRYNLALPQELFTELQRAADERHTTVVELLRKFIKLGLMIIQVEDSQSATLFIREGDTERQIVIV